MVAQLPYTHDTVDEMPDVAELRGVAGALLTRLAGLRERDAPVPDELWRAAERFQPLLDGIEPDPGEAEELWELALALPRLFAAAGRPVGDEAAALLVGDRVQHVEARGA